MFPKGGDQNRPKTEKARSGADETGFSGPHVKRERQDAVSYSTFIERGRGPTLLGEG